MKQAIREPQHLVTTEPDKLWPNGILPYVIEDKIGMAFIRELINNFTLVRAWHISVVKSHANTCCVPVDM